jgi:hypothetical protein
MSTRLFKGKLVHPTTKYIGVPIGPRGLAYLDIAWNDAVSSAAITLETCVNPTPDVLVAGTAQQWKTDAGTAITGPNASAIGSSKVQLKDYGPCRARLKIVTAANCDFEIWEDNA